MNEQCQNIMAFVHSQTQGNTGCGPRFTLSLPRLQFQQEVIRADSSSQVKPILASSLHHSVRQQFVYIYTPE